MIRTSIILFFVSLAIVAGQLPLQMLPQLQVTGAGVFVDELAPGGASSLGHVFLCAAPKPGQCLTLSRGQISNALAKAGIVVTNFDGAEQVRITRRMRPLAEDELRTAVVAQLQRDIVKDRGELELRMARPWTEVSIPDESYTLRISDLPSSGISSLFLCRVELLTPNETLGSWQVSFNAKIWREVWVSATPLRRGTSLGDADLSRERRDVISIREPLADFASPDPAFEISDYAAPNAPLLARSIRCRPVIRRGQTVDASVVDGSLSISMKVDVLEDGIPGQVIRLRNPLSRRELRGKVQNERTILITL